MLNSNASGALLTKYAEFTVSITWLEVIRMNDFTAIENDCGNSTILNNCHPLKSCKF